MRLLKSIGLALGVLLTFASIANAHEITVGDLTITHPQARPNLPNRPTAAYMVITNDGKAADRLLSAKSSAFGAVEMHTTIKQGDVMKMMPVDVIEVPAEDSAVLEPGGLHLMLFEGSKAFKVDEMFPLTLTFEQAGEVEVMVKVEKISGGMSHGQHGSGHSGHNTSN